MVVTEEPVVHVTGAIVVRRHDVPGSLDWNEAGAPVVFVGLAFVLNVVVVASVVHIVVEVGDVDDAASVLRAVATVLILLVANEDCDADLEPEDTASMLSIVELVLIVLVVKEASEILATLDRAPEAIRQDRAVAGATELMDTFPW